MDLLMILGQSPSSWWRSPTRWPATGSSEAHMNLENVLMLLVSVLLMIYLIYALLQPEKF
jgi:K+-transporting ATPase KdpF subunit